MYNYYQQGAGFACPVRTETETERKNRLLRRYGNIIGLTVAISIFAFQVLFTVIFLIFPNADGHLFDIWTQIIYSLLLVVFPVLFMTRLAHRPLGRLVAAERVPARLLWPIVGAMLGADMVISFLAQPVSIGNYNAMVSGLPTGSPYLVALIFITDCVVPALTEEFAMRGVLLGLLRPFGDTFAVVASATVFSLMHGNMMQAPSAFCIGLLFGYIAVKTGSVWPGVIVHFANNFISTLLQYFIQNSTDTAAEIANCLITAAFLVVGAVCIAYLSFSHKWLFSLKLGGDKPAERLKYGRFFGSVGMIILYVLFGLMALLTLVSYGI
ncbi:MAG: type II CAAX endopeptidase family protein [Firmicutes bacterium]|nr:type II CAAX endopeptidase family protein [Bacillota bacterium]